jgi:hypothetical protein
MHSKYNDHNYRIIKAINTSSVNTGQNFQALSFTTKFRKLSKKKTTFQLIEKCCFNEFGSHQCRYAGILHQTISMAYAHKWFKEYMALANTVGDCSLP